MSNDHTGCCQKEVSKLKKACKTGEKEAAFYVCQDCQQVTHAPEAICRPREVSPSYVCQKCGSRSATQKSLCKPKPA